MFSPLHYGRYYGKCLAPRHAVKEVRIALKPENATKADHKKN